MKIRKDCEHAPDDSSAVAVCSQFIPAIESGRAGYKKGVIEHHEALIRRGNAYAKMRKFDLATKDLKEALPMLGETGRAGGYNHIGVVYNDMGDYDRAIAYFDEAVRLDPKFSNAYNNRAIAWSNKGDSAKAREDYANAIRAEQQ